MAFESKRLTAKLSRSCVAGDLAPSSILVDRLDDRQARVPAIVSDSAGHGKSTRISGRMVVCDHPSAWLSTDEDGDDPGQELDLQRATIRTLFAGTIGQGRGVLKAEGPPARCQPWPSGYPRTGPIGVLPGRPGVATGMLA